MYCQQQTKEGGRWWSRSLFQTKKYTSIIINNNHHNCIQFTLLALRVKLSAVKVNWGELVLTCILLLMSLSLFVKVVI